VGKGCKNVRNNNHQTEVGLREGLSDSIGVDLMLLWLISLRKGKVAAGYGE